MDIMDLASNLGIAVLAIGAAGWLGRAIVQTLLERDVAEFKSKLQVDHDVAVERLRADLGMRSIEHEIRFGQIHARQAEALVKTYGLVFQSYETLARYVQPFEYGNAPSKDERLKDFNAAYEDFRNYFYSNRILLPRQTAARVGALTDGIVKTANEFTFGRRLEEKGRYGADHWEMASKAIKEQLDPLLELMEEDFQALLGVRSPQGGK